MVEGGVKSGKAGVDFLRSLRRLAREAMTTANKVTIARILLVPFFVMQVLYYVEAGVEYHRLLAILCFALASISDGIDGYIARRYHQRSELGAILDPLADKLLLVSGVVLLSFDHAPHLPRFPLWLTVTVLSRDVLLAIGLWVVQHTCGKAVVRPSLLGKAATVMQMTCVLWALLKWPGHWLFVWLVLAAALTALSGVFYIIDGVGQLSASPKSTASPRQ